MQFNRQKADYADTEVKQDKIDKMFDSIENDHYENILDLSEEFDLNEQIIQEASIASMLHSLSATEIEKDEDPLDEVIFEDPEDTIYWEQDDTDPKLYKEKEPMAEAADNDTLMQISELNKKLNSYKYAFYNNGKILNQSNDDYENLYHFSSPKQFEKQQGGVCWDYVAYQADYFNTHFPDVKYNAWFIMYKDGEDEPDHTIFTFILNSKWYWFESSYKQYRGIWEANNENDLISFAANAMIDSKKNTVDNYEFYKKSYNPSDSSFYGANMETCLAKFNKDLKKFKPNKNTKVVKLDNINEAIGAAIMTGMTIASGAKNVNSYFNNWYKQNEITDYVIFGTSEQKMYKCIDKTFKFKNTAERAADQVDRTFIYLRTSNNLNKKQKERYDIAKKYWSKVKKEYKAANESVENINEAILKDEPDIYYNKDKFDSDEINLCFITGFSGSGKSTMAQGMESKNIEIYELDDVTNISAFSDDNLKEYGDLIYLYFKGPGKKYRIPYQGLTDKWFEENGFGKISSRCKIL